eukprot:CAMPEP_0115842136 /NCGR_PEP_ID=MMETSP0287-20121206/7644_1 /TAXON_ID=412157 /ORGANISM="Chrysochromulina rotalis, Strain UIO044" /LENGTH=83 /DNA_ID=CAMNT_0003295795 /DNA_START=642 /DNA_END=890 /DNA_ORIENTATION=+
MKRTVRSVASGPVWVVQTHVTSRQRADLADDQLATRATWDRLQRDAGRPLGGGGTPRPRRFFGSTTCLPIAAPSTRIGPHRAN